MCTSLHRCFLPKWSSLEKNIYFFANNQFRHDHEFFIFLCSNTWQCRYDSDSSLVSDRSNRSDFAPTLKLLLPSRNIKHEKLLIIPISGAEAYTQSNQRFHLLPRFIQVTELDFFLVLPSP